MIAGISAALAYSGMIGTLSTSHTSDGIEYTLKCAKFGDELPEAEYRTIEFAVLLGDDGSVVKLKLPSGKYQEMNDDTILVGALYALVNSDV